jgi:hypothetical protein
VPFWTARLLTYELIRLTVQNKERMPFAERESILCFPPFIAESEQAVIEEKVREGAVFRGLVDGTPDGYQTLLVESLRVHYRSYVTELLDAVLLIITLLLKVFLGSPQKTCGQCKRARHR